MTKAGKIAVMLVGILALSLLGAKLFARNRKTVNLTNRLPTNGSYPSRSLSDIRYLVIHHSASENQSPEDYAAYHIQHHGWPGIGYHYVIDPDGTVFQTNNLTAVSYHVENHNTPSVGIVLSGNLNNHHMTKAQEQALNFLIQKLRRILPNQLEIKAHRDFKTTDCPGRYTDISQIRV